MKSSNGQSRIIKKLPYDLTSNAGLALVGQYFKRLGIDQRIDTKYPISGKGIANSDILKSYLGLLVNPPKLSHHPL